MVDIRFTVPAGCVSARIDLWCPPANGGICYFDACEVRRMDGFLGDEGTLLAWAKVANAGVWTDSTARRLVYLLTGATTRIILYRDTANNAFTFFYQANGVTESQTTAGLTNIDFVTYGMTWDIAAGATGEVRYYIDGVPSGPTDVGLGTWIGDLDNTQTVIGAGSTIPGNVWSGLIGPVPIFNEAKSPAEMKYLMSP